MENLNRVLLENVLPAHVAEHFLGRNWKNEVNSQSYTIFIIHGLAFNDFNDSYLLKEQLEILGYMPIDSNVCKVFM